jgi:hypothetical protein
LGNRPASWRQVFLRDERVDVIRERERDDVGRQTVDHGARLFA